MSGDRSSLGKHGVRGIAISEPELTLIMLASMAPDKRKQRGNIVFRASATIIMNDYFSHALFHGIFRSKNVFLRVCNLILQIDVLEIWLRTAKRSLHFSNIYDQECLAILLCCVLN